MVGHFKTVAEEKGFILVGMLESKNGLSWYDYAGYEMAVIRDIRSRVLFDPTAQFAGGFSGGAMAAYQHAIAFRHQLAGVIAMGGWLGQQYSDTERMHPGLLVARTTGNDDTNARAWLPNDKNYLLAWECVVRDWSFRGGHQPAPDSVLREVMDWLLESREIQAENEIEEAQSREKAWRNMIAGGEMDQYLVESLSYRAGNPRTWGALYSAQTLDEVAADFDLSRTADDIFDNGPLGDSDNDSIYDDLFFRAYAAAKLDDRDRYYTYSRLVTLLAVAQGVRTERTDDMMGLYGHFPDFESPLQLQMAIETPGASSISVAQSVEGKTYRLYQSTNLIDWSLADEQSGDGADITFSVHHSSGEPVFMKVQSNW